METERLSPETVEQALRQIREDQNRETDRMIAIAEYLSANYPCKLEPLWAGSGSRWNSVPVALCWRYCDYDLPNKWLYDQVKLFPAPTPVGVHRDSPCFRWQGTVPSIGPVDVLVIGEYYDSHFGGW